MEPPACAVGRIDPEGPWVGFAPGLDDGYLLVVGSEAGPTRSTAATPRDLIAMAVAHFEESLFPPPDDLAATHGDIGALVRHVAEHERDFERRSVLDEAVDAVDDGLAADVTIARLTRMLGDGTDAASWLRRRTEELLGGS